MPKRAGNAKVTIQGIATKFGDNQGKALFSIMQNYPLLSLTWDKRLVLIPMIILSFLFIT